MPYRFYGGVHPDPFKHLTQDKPTKRTFIPAKVVIPLSQHTGSPAEPVVAVGDDVEVGALIAKATGYISSPVHATIGGKVTKIAYTPTPVMARTLSITIESSGGDQEFKPRPRPDAGALSRENLLDIIKDAGIVGMGGAAFPAYVKLSPPKNKTIDSLILNGAECEPYLTCDHRLMLERSKEIIKGLEISAKILDSKDIYIAVEDNKQSAIYTMEKTLRSLATGSRKIKVIVLKTVYPQGAEKQVIKAVLNRTVPAGGLPMDVGCVVQNVGTVFAIYEAAYLGKPMIERNMTITGDCVKDPVNINVRFGTLLGDLAPAFGGFSKEPKRIVAGGPMMGIAQYTMDVPVIKGTSGILFLSDGAVDKSKESVCIRCGKCVDVCPMKLVPTTLMNNIKKEFFKEAKDLGLMNCFECGACAYFCPAKIPLLDYMKFGKAKV
ncbi:MAG: electron transport complex subunit RsxC [Candidatus Omnitrophota bacterium]